MEIRPPFVVIVGLVIPPLSSLVQLDITNNLATVSNSWEDEHGWNISYRRNLKEEEFEDWLTLTNLLSTVNPTRDKWTWNVDKNGNFSFYSLLDAI